MKHEEAWQRLPDLLDDRDDYELLAHVRGCADCQRQLFLLGRVNRMLREQAPAGRRHSRMRGPAAAAAALVVAVGVALSLIVPDASRAREMMLRTASGRPVGHAALGRSDARNLSLALTASGLPLNRQHMFVLWAGDAGSTMQVGRFMVDRSGNCRVRFNLPATHSWRHFWVAQPEDPAAIVAST
jgi:hypothetical protein